jgi:hypothetical protein
MTTSRASAPLKRLTHTPDQPSSAQPAGAPTGRSAPKNAAEGVPSAVRLDPRAEPRQRVIGWLHIAAPADRHGTARATSHCDCGRHLTAHGHDQVLALIADHHDHRTACPLHTAPKRRKAA